MSRNNMEEDGIEAAFMAGAMPPEWRPRLRASGLDDGDVNTIAEAIAKTHPIMRSTFCFFWRDCCRV
ncbi:hypothetical protein E2562_004657 [Oryza meyeriana var. granulata]|uniref:Uncharacterized protein n=1 Tax=Oryza meyeriana var. granulata TaxID=110450 RepID=A0A6G1DFZ4_9ORYZ|nr:hypothetical protein E2562_004657 [Oryza meyeriana var. granulata]